MMRKPVTATLKNVADRAGVSMMTVSLALRGGPTGSRISEETRQRVQEAARALDYHPNARARALRYGTTNIIGLYAGYGFVNVRKPFFTEIVSGLQEGCEQFKKDLLLHGIFHADTPDDVFNELADGRIDGLIVNMAAENPLARRLADSHLPVVAVADPLNGIPSVLVDDAAGSRLLARHLVERSFRRCIYLGSSLPALSAKRRRDAFLQEARAIGLGVVAVDESDRGPWHEEVLPNLLSQIHASKPLAIACWNDDTAYGVLAACRAQGFRVPEEVAIVGFDGCPTPYDTVWSLTTVRAPWAAVARTAVAHLVRLLEGDPVGTSSHAMGTSSHVVPPETVLPVELIPGQTA